MRLEDALIMWVGWIKRSRVDLRFSASAAFCRDGLSCWDDLEDELDYWICRVVNVSVNDLEPLLYNAIAHKYLLERFRFPYEFYQIALIDARCCLQKILISRHVVLDK